MKFQYLASGETPLGNVFVKIAPIPLNHPKLRCHAWKITFEKRSSNTCIPPGGRCPRNMGVHHNALMCLSFCGLSDCLLESVGV